MNAVSDAITVRGLHKSYKTAVAVDGVDLDVHSGEVFALLGPNGAGKTTTVEGFRKRTAGEVQVLGVDPQHGDQAWRGRVGIVLQSTGEFDDLTVAEVVHHFARYYSNADDPDSGLTLCPSAQEYDLSTLLSYPGEIVELGRSCVDSDYRIGSVMQMLWRGLAEYVREHAVPSVRGQL